MEVKLKIEYAVQFSLTRDEALWLMSVMKDPTIFAKNNFDDNCKRNMLAEEIEAQLDA